MTRLRRSELSTPGSNERMIEKAAASAADLVFLDLEDSVAAPEKPAAREKSVAALRDLDWGRKTRAVRVNAPGSDWIEADLETVVRGAAALDVVIVPKVRSGAEVRAVERRLEGLERGLGRTVPIGLEVLVEEVESLAAVEEIATSSPRLEALIFGSGDMAASQGVRTRWLRDYPGDPWIYHRSRIVVAARAAGLSAIDGPYWGPIEDLAGYGEECRQVSTLGYAGKWAIHPAQIDVANETFSPTRDELEHARRVVGAYGEAAARGQGAIRLDGVMVDAVDLRLAEQLLEAQQTLQ
jgi:citrate lyase subunit beta / citryl-CoA lyase